MINDNLKEQNINNYDDEGKEEEKEVRQNILNKNKENKNYIGITSKLINPMNSEIEQLKEALIKSNEKINILIEENNKLKITQGDNMKELLIKEGIIDSNKQEISRLLSKITSYENEEEIKNKTIKDLNYKIIELNQKIESKETIDKITQKIKNENPEDLEHNYLIEINELNNKINEIEIKNSKLKFDNEKLTNKIEIIIKEKKTELEIMESLYNKKNGILEKEIERLNDMINELLNEKEKEHIDIYDYKNIQNDIYKFFKELEEKMKKLNDVNFLIKKENQKLKNENEELSIIINGKETIIEKLQSNINKIENDFKQRLSERNIINNNDNIDQLLNEQKKLSEENEILRNNYEEMTQGINEANELFVSKQKEYENIINSQMEKLKEYKFKISILKIKVNELHSEIEFLQEKQIKSPNNYLSTIEKDKNSLDSNYTPEQMKISGPDNTLNIKTDSINNNENN